MLIKVDKVHRGWTPNIIYKYIKITRREIWYPKSKDVEDTDYTKDSVSNYGVSSSLLSSFVFSTPSKTLCHFRQQ